MFRRLKIILLMKKFNSKRSFDHHNAAAELKRMNDPLAVEPLIKSLKSADKFVRINAAELLGSLKDIRAAEPLIELLGDAELVSTAAEKALYEIKDPRIIAPLVKRFSKASYISSESKVAIVRILGKLKDPGAVGPLIDAIGGYDSDVQRLAAIYLGESGDLRAVDPLIKALSDRASNVRGEAANALGKLKDIRAIGPLMRLLADGEGNVRKNAAQALDKLGQSQWKEIVTGTDKDFEKLAKSNDPKIIEHFISALEKGDEKVRINAARALGGTESILAIDGLIRALKDNSCEVREAVAEALGELGGLRAAAPLIEALSDSYSGVRKNAAAALGKLKDEHAVEPLMKLLDDDEDVFIAAATALGKIKSPKAVDKLIEILGAGASAVRTASAKALHELGETQWKTAIRGNMDDFPRLADMEDPRVLKPLIKALGDSSWEVRKAGAVSIILYAEKHRGVKILSREIVEMIKQPYENTHQDYDYHQDDSHGSSDCSWLSKFYHMDKHTDTGIGVDVTEF